MMNSIEKQRLAREYGVDRLHRMERSKRIQRMVGLISILSFAGSTLFALEQFFGKDLNHQKQESHPTATSQVSPLILQEQGYQKVLQREPENQVALEGLVQVRLEMKNFKGAVEPLEKLIKLYPDRQDYRVVLEQLKKQVEKGQGKGDR